MKLVDDLLAFAVISRATAIPERPGRIPGALAAMRRWGGTLAAGTAASAALYPEAAAIVDEGGRETSYAELWQRSCRLAGALSETGVAPGMNVGIMCRNHRGFVEAMLASAMCGANVVFLNTGFAGPQLADVVTHEGIQAVVHDDEFEDAVRACGTTHAFGERALERMSSVGPSTEPRTPRRPGSVVVLTSGTTGRPKGASRSALGGTSDAAFLLEQLPLRTRDVTVIAAPLFHGWGLTNLAFGLGLSAKIVLDREFDPERTIASISRERATIIAAVPVMLERMLALGGETLVRYDTSSLRVIASGGSAPGASLVTRLLDRFGPVVYNLYGSTEVALATIATPRDLRLSPATAGRVVRGARVRLIDEAGKDVARGQTGRVFVGNRLRFEGYTGGGGKDTIAGLLPSGDLGHFDAHGRLFIDGREDDMIVSGGENVFPAEVEELLAAQPEIHEAAVVGVPDAEFGQRLKAVVVKAPGATLDADAVRCLVREHLARYKVPRDVVFVDELPRTETGKVLRRMLA